MAIAHRMGLVAGLTSNGENGAAVIPDWAKAGLDRVNLSVFGTTPHELTSVQGARLASLKLAERKLKALGDTVAAALTHGVRVSANIVVPDSTHVSRVRCIVEEYGKDVVVRMFVSLEDGGRSLTPMREMLDRLKAVPEQHIVTAGASDQRTRYLLPDGRPIYAKSIRPVRLPDICAGCRFNNDRDCQEGYYGIRPYRAASGPFMVGVCIQCMDLCVPLGQFMMGELCHEVQAFRDTEAASLAQLHHSQASGHARAGPDWPCR